MKKQLFLLSSLCLMLTACENRTPPSPNADNTGRNVRDRGATLTPENQSESEADRTITQKVRQALVDDEALSFYAKNIKIITINGVVTLRGAVNSEKEKIEAGKKAKAISGVRSVDNQLEVVRTDNPTTVGPAGTTRNL